MTPRLLFMWKQIRKSADKYIFHSPTSHRWLLMNFGKKWNSFNSRSLFPTSDEILMRIKHMSTLTSSSLFALWFGAVCYCTRPLCLVCFGVLHCAVLYCRKVFWCFMLYVVSVYCVAILCSAAVLSSIMLSDLCCAMINWTAFQCLVVLCRALFCVFIYRVALR